MLVATCLESKRRMFFLVLLGLDQQGVGGVRNESRYQKPKVPRKRAGQPMELVYETQQDCTR